MASKRDLVEAHSFNRRRLVTAFLSGAPGGREVEPVRYGRTLAGGIVLAALLVAGAAVAGVLKPAVGDGWRENGLVIAKDSRTAPTVRAAPEVAWRSFMRCLLGSSGPDGGDDADRDDEEWQEGDE